MLQKLLLLVAIFGNIAMAQFTIPSTVKLNREGASEPLQKSKASASLLLFMNSDNFIKEHVVSKQVTINGRQYLDCFIALNESDIDSGKEALKQLGVLVRGTYGNILTAYVPVDRIKDVLELSVIKYVDPAKPAIQQLDSARRAVRADITYSGFGLSHPFRGDSVIIGIVDVGFDLTHPTLYDTSGNMYRVLYLWDHYINSGVAPSPYGYGSEFSAAQILSTPVEYSFNADEISHGMHVAGIAAGSGHQKPQYRGIAPNANLILVELDNSSDAKFIDAIDYIFRKANQLNMPAVVNLSWGSNFGPKDGTSLFDRALANLTGPGRIVVGAAGNEGTNNFHLGFNFNYFTGDTLIITTESLVNHQILISTAFNRWYSFQIPNIYIVLSFMGYGLGNVWHKARTIVSLQEIVMWQSETDYLPEGKRRQKTIASLIWNSVVEIQNNPAKVFSYIAQNITSLYGYEREFVYAFLDAIFIKISKQTRVNSIYIANIVSLGRKRNLGIEVMGSPYTQFASQAVFKQSLEAAQQRLTKFKDKYTFVDQIITQLNLLLAALKS